MENQYYTLIEKQDFFEIIENKFGELAVFIDARKGEPVNPQLEYDGKTTALLKRDGRLAVKLEGINAETGAVLAESEFVMIVELSGETVERSYGVRLKRLRNFHSKAVRPVPTNWNALKANRKSLKRLAPLKSGKAEKNR